MALVSSLCSLEWSGVSLLALFRHYSESSGSEVPVPGLLQVWGHVFLVATPWLPSVLTGQAAGALWPATQEPETQKNQQT